MTTILPLYDNVLVEPLYEEEAKGKFYVPEDKLKTQRGKVCAFDPSEVKEINGGDIIHFEKTTETMFEIDGKELVIIPADKILCKENNNEEKKQ